MTRYAIGDIQGCMSTLERLLALIEFDRARDELWLVGDLVNRGPRSLDVLRWARELGDRATVVLGNHDLHLLARAAGAAPAKKRDTLDEVLAAPDLPALCDWLRTRSLLHVDGGFLLVHAGLHQGWTALRARELAGELEVELRGPKWKAWIAQTIGGAPKWRDTRSGAERVESILGFLIRVRMCDADGNALSDFDGPPEEAPPGARPWYDLNPPALRDHVAVFGHWAAHGARQGRQWIATDSACVWGGALTAVRLADRHVFTMPAVEPPAS